MRVGAAWAFLMAPLWAGQSLRLNGNQTVGNTSVAAQSINAPCRIEFQLSYTSNPLAGVPARVNACDFNIQFAANQLLIYPTTDTGWSCCVNIPTTMFASNWLILRFQQIPSGAGGSLVWEAWDINGVRQFSHTEIYTGTTGVHSNGANVGSSGNQDCSWGFFRVYTTTVPLGSREPTFADHGDLLDWQFNNSLADSGPHHYNASGASPSSVCGSAPCYEATSGQTLVTAVIKTNPAPVWSNFQSWRAGSTVGLDGSASVSMGDASSIPALEWQILSGPSKPIWSSHTSVMPTLTGIVFGNYVVQLAATNPQGGSATAIQDVGAVAYYDNGVVLSADPKVSQIFGPQIAFGQNPWGYEDERNLKAIQLQIANNAYYATSTWLTTGQGTVAYPFAGKGAAPGQTCTTLSSGITASSTSIPVANASCLSLSALPTTILIGTGYGSSEAVRICSATAVSGPSTLMACYDGRGIATSAAWDAATVAAQSWSAGTAVGEYRIQGTGTLFASDANRPLCPAGLPGPMGRVAYATGTVRLAASSATVTGTGTAWATSGAWNGYTIQVHGTHGGGTAFNIWGTISTVGTTTSLTMNRPAPADVDTSTDFTYAILSPIYLSLDFSDSNSTYRALQNGVYCESETAAFGLTAHDIVAFDATNQTGQKYSYKLSLGAASAFGPNFYGTGLAAREFYYRSGWGPALALANQIDENWTRDPEQCAGLCGGLVLLYGGGAVGGIVDKVLNPSTSLSWYDVLGWGSGSASYASSSCNALDARDSGYSLAITALFDMFDSARQSTWDSAMTQWASREDSCRRKASDGYSGVEVHSWASGAYFNPGQFSSTLTLTSGSTAISPTTPHGLVPTMCAGVDDGTGTITVTRDSGTATVVSGSVANGGLRIWITDTSVSPAYYVALSYSGSGGSGSRITLGGLWPGKSGTYKFMVEDNSLSPLNFASIARDATDSYANNKILEETWACHYVDSDHATLNRPWDNLSGSNWAISYFNVSGWATQPFMLGIKRTGLWWASQAPNSALASSFSTLLPYIGNWMNTYGTDGDAGSPYARVMQACEPILTPTPGTTFLTTHGGGDGNCGLNGLWYVNPPTTEAADRSHNAEAGTAMLSYYLANPNAITRSNTDKFYGQVFGYCPYTLGGGTTFYCDSHYVNTGAELSDTALGAYKWSGFFFGVGGLFANSWPAIRVGGIPPPMPRTVTASCNISSVTNAAKCRVTITKPDGTTSTNTCTTSPCPVTADGREGEHLLKVDYLDASDNVMASGEVTPVRVN